MATAVEVQGTLQMLASRLTADGHFLQAIKCYTALLTQPLLPADEATARLQLAQLLLEHTHNLPDAKLHLQKAVSSPTAACSQYEADCTAIHGYQAGSMVKHSSCLQASTTVLVRADSLQETLRLFPWSKLLHHTLMHTQDMLVAQLPSQSLLKCEVLAQLGRAHKYLGETSFRRQCYLKGLDLCKQHISSNSHSSSTYVNKAAAGHCCAASMHGQA